MGSYRFGGRYNPAGSFEVLYLVTSPVTALEEVEALLRSGEGLQGAKEPPRVLLLVECRLQAVVEPKEHLTRLNVTLADLMLPWRDRLWCGEMPVTHTLGSLAYARGDVEALLVPSAKNPETFNLAVFPDRVRAGSSLRVFDDSGMIDARLP